MTNEDYFEEFEEVDLGDLLSDIKQQEDPKEEEEPQPEPVEEVEEEMTGTEKKQYYISVQLRRRVANVDPQELWRYFEENKDPIWLVYGVCK